MPTVLSHLKSLASALPAIDSAVRLSLSAAPNPRATVDGAWWPRSRDAAAELPALIAAVDRRLGRTTLRVGLHAGAWEHIPRRIPARGRQIRVGWFRNTDPHLISLISSGAEPVMLLVVPPGTADGPATAALTLAAPAAPGLSPADILTRAGESSGPGIATPAPDGPTDRKDEGGHATGRKVGDGDAAGRKNEGGDAGRKAGGGDAVGWKGEGGHAVGWRPLDAPAGRFRPGPHQPPAIDRARGHAPLRPGHPLAVADAFPLGRARPSAPTTVHLSGEIDIFTSPELRQHLMSALRSSTSLLILDLSGVSFCDASGLAVLVGVQHRARAMGVVLALAAPRPAMTRLLRITGLDRSLPMAAPTGMSAACRT
ncbi:hypothetical protein Misp01_63840 [Microtetraspora sp. NBRC 13810]|uniref:STAS domain-containing protein n=1 Tax=Microtetraspora sp. NBRC 13810 TaxID=3030990 RepID=UPI0024A3F96D|nr:STAS domain-containing protein [Microtetraspora sp. NBRC 13810]GLW11256.1 hypothetical protein Misp01_63840 [Microtetraspora sp. NBRC 13810]